jgi:asparagine synthase (glutamine-hydrolysing)
MCGFCGVIGFDEGAALAQRMSDRIIHRGPDSFGFLNRPPIHLGVRRLKIIDFAKGDQPIFNEDRTIAIVFNGEIYNFQQLYDELISYGHRFETQSDTETIVHAYEQWGPDCPAHLRGMFSFAIWDLRVDGRDGAAPSLFLARDRFGIKPLYIWHDDEHMMFASEVRALLATGVIPRRISAAGLFSFLTFGSVQEPLSLIDGIVSLPPASWMKVSLVDGKLVTKQGVYWEPPDQRGLPADIDHIHVLLKDSVSSHLISDAQLGVFLSGGLDSGTIASLASGSTSVTGLDAIMFGFKDMSNNEVELAKLTAERSRLSLSIATVRQDALLEDLPHIFQDMDQPTLDGINSWYISREARRVGWKVALSGVGGDELFAGYPSFGRAQIMNRMPTSWHWMRSASEWSLPARVFPGGPDASRKFFSYLGGDPPLGHSYYAIRGLFTFTQVTALLNGCASGAMQSDAFSQWMDVVRRQVHFAGRYDEIGQMSWLELSQYMRSTLLRDLDAMSMAHSLEVRVPFVDHLLVEAILPIAASHKYDRRRPKKLLVEAMRDRLPHEVTSGAKRTFTFPFHVWLRQNLSHRVKKKLEDCLDMPEWFDAQQVSRVWDDFEQGKTSWSRPWTLFVLGEWAQAHLQ